MCPIFSSSVKIFLSFSMYSLVTSVSSFLSIGTLTASPQQNTKSNFMSFTLSTNILIFSMSSWISVTTSIL